VFRTDGIQIRLQAKGCISSNKLEIHPVFPTEFALLKSASINLTKKTQALKQAREKLSIEREEIYKTLKTCKRTNPEVWERLYSSLKIPESALQKKRKVVKMLWEHPACKYLWPHFVSFPHI